MTTGTEPVTKTVHVGQNRSEDDQKAIDAAMAALNKAVPPPAEEPQPETPVQAPEEPKEDLVCPRCGHAKGGENKPSEVDVQEYARAILGSRQFTKTYTLMGGQIQFKFTTLDGKTSEQLNSLMIGMNAIEEVIRYNSVALKYRILFMLRSYSIGGKEVSLDPPSQTQLIPGDYAAVDALFSEKIEHLDQGVVQMLAQSLMLFRGLETALIQGAFDETFWKGAGPC